MGGVSRGVREGLVAASGCAVGERNGGVATTAGVVPDRRDVR